MAVSPTNRTLQSRFEGCLLGALFGDCLGAKFERHWSDIPIKTVVTYFEKVKKQVENNELEAAEKGYVRYTDDSCMTFDLAESLVNKKEFKAKNVAKKFCETFFAAPFHRNYGNHVGFVFDDLRDMKYSGDILKPAREQFDGTGSYGNGSAMRVSPVPLFHHNNISNIVKLATEQSKLTHTHPHGINGAVLQALAIEKALNSETISNPINFCNELITLLKEYSPAPHGVQIYEDQMKSVVQFLMSTEPVDTKKINSEIGSNVTAQQAVPASILAFLYTLDEDKIPELSDYNGLERATIFAVAFGRDSDTIGSMTAVIAGSYYGVEQIPSEWKFACEGGDKALMLAEKLLKINGKKKS